MQPVYQIPGDLLKSHAASLDAIASVRDCPGELYALLFLTGLHFAFSYFRVSQSGDEFYTNLAPEHCLDDGLDRVANIGLKQLLKQTRRPSTLEAVKYLQTAGSCNPNWLSVSLAFSTFYLKADIAITDWLKNGDEEENKKRLSCAMGVIALWSNKTVGFIHDLMRGPFSLDEQTASAIKAFVVTVKTALPEL